MKPNLPILDQLVNYHMTGVELTISTRYAADEIDATFYKLQGYQYNNETGLCTKYTERIATQ